MKNFLLDAMNEISDEHIAEAVTYEPKIKAITWKRAVGIAACLIIALVSAFAITSGNTPVEPSAVTDASIIVTTAASVTEGTTVAGAAAPAITAAPTIAAPETEASTTVAGEKATAHAAPEFTSEATTVASAKTTVASADTTASVTDETTYDNSQKTTAACTTTAPWEMTPYSSCYRGFNFGGIDYINYYGALIGEDNLSDLIGKTILTATDDKGNEHSVNVDVFSIKNVSTDCAVAVYFWDGVQKQHCAQGYYVYYNKNYTAENLGQMMDDMDFSNKMLLGVSDIYIHYDKTLLGMVTTHKYIINESAKTAFNKLLNNSRNIKGEKFDHDSKIGTENLVIYGSYLGTSVSFHLNSDGYLCFGLGENELQYDVGKEAFKELMKVIESECQIENSTSPALCVTTSGITQSY